MWWHNNTEPLFFSLRGYSYSTFIDSLLILPNFSSSPSSSPYTLLLLPGLSNPNSFFLKFQFHNFSFLVSILPTSHSSHYYYILNFSHPHRHFISFFAFLLLSFHSSLSPLPHFLLHPLPMPSLCTLLLTVECWRIQERVVFLPLSVLQSWLLAKTSGFNLKIM